MADGLLRAFRFGVTLLRSPEAESGEAASRAAGSADRLGDGGFQECSGLELEQDVQEYLEGGRNDGVIRRVGRVKYPPIVLRRGMFYSGNAVNRDLWIWIQDIARGVRPVRRFDGTVEVYTVNYEVMARWEFDRGLPLKVKGPELNAKTGEVAIEELHIAHEGLRLAGPETGA
jgi:phage tail-like protein